MSDPPRIESWVTTGESLSLFEGKPTDLPFTELGEGTEPRGCLPKENYRRFWKNILFIWDFISTPAYTSSLRARASSSLFDNLQ